MTPHELLGAAAVPSIVGLVEVLKSAGRPARLAPIAAVLLGVAGALIAVYQIRYPALQATEIGIALGLSATGLHGGARAIAGASSSPPAPTTSKPETTPAAAEILTTSSLEPIRRPPPRKSPKKKLSELPPVDSPWQQQDEGDEVKDAPHS